MNNKETTSDSEKYTSRNNNTENSDQYSQALVPQFTSQSSVSTAFTDDRLLPPSPFKAYLRQSPRATTAVIEWPGKSNLATDQIPVVDQGNNSNASELKQFLAALSSRSHGMEVATSSSALTIIPPVYNTNFNAFVRAISSGRTGLSSKSALGDSTDLAFPFGEDMDLVCENHSGPDQAIAGAAAKDNNSDSMHEVTTNTQVINRRNGNIVDSEANGLAIAPQIESFVRHVEAFSLSVTVSSQSVHPSQEEEDSSQQLSRQLSEFRRFRANMN